MSRRDKESYNWLDDPFDEKKAAAERECMNAKGAFPVAGCLIVGVVALILVVGNGDVRCGADAVALREKTGCDAIMIGRGAEGNPWVFAQVKAALTGKEEPVRPSIAERLAMARRHAHLLAEREGRNIVRMRKHAMWYMAGLPGASTARGKINACVTPEDFDKVFDELLAFAAAHESAHEPASSAALNKEAN